MQPFMISRPRTLALASEAARADPERALLRAGGVDLIDRMKEGIDAPAALVELRGIEGDEGEAMRAVKAEGEGLHIGALVTLAQLAAHEALGPAWAALREAAGSAATPAIRNAATLGGNLLQRPRCWYFRHGYGLTATRDGTSLVREGQNRYHAIFATDGPALFVSPSSLGPPLIALGASVVIAGPDNSERTIPVAEFFRIPASDEERENALRPGEILTAIIIPDRGLRNATFEVRHRRGLDWPYVTASVAFRMEDQTARDARVVLGHVAPVPWSAREAEGALESGRLHAGLAARCGAAAATGAQPLRQNAYKVQMVGAAVQRAILQAADL